MPLLLVDALEPADAAALRAHLSTGCPRCAAYLAEADAMLAYLPFALDPVTPPASARQKLFDRLSVPEPAPAQAPRRTLRLPAWVRIGAPILAAACLAIIATAAFLLPRIDRLQTALNQSDRTLRALTTQSQAKDQIIEIVNSEQFRQIKMQGRAQPKATARLLWDDRRQCWHIFVQNLEPLSDRETYELWFITPYGRKVPAGLFKVDLHGEAKLTVQVPKEVGPIEAAMVTDEPHVGTFAPTGSVHLFGKIE